MILFDGKIKKNIPNEKIKCLKFQKKVKICCVYLRVSMCQPFRFGTFFVYVVGVKHRV